MSRVRLAALAALALAAVPARGASNKLAGEKSPYLLKHAADPVDWVPWGDEAFAKAKSEGKPVFLSIGYAACHWCGAMERESFADPKIAELLNANFVPVLVDREERPDVDRAYSEIAAAQGWGSGWPLNLFLAPDRRAFDGGNYFAPEAFAAVLRSAARRWSEDPNAAAAPRREPDAPPSDAVLDARPLDEALASFRADYDGKNGGFGGAPKFPRPAQLDFLLRAYSRTGNAEALSIATTTLRAMAAGGIHDQLGGGFHRYATDAAWRLPHFEKLLVDNAQLASVYLEAYQATKDPELARAARGTLDYVLDRLTLPGGAFAAAESADSAALGATVPTEGAYYLWTAAEFDAAAGTSAALARARWGVVDGGNVAAFPGRNVLYEASRGPELEDARLRLRAARDKRAPPERDDQMLTSWNGLMISALSRGAQVLGEPRYAAAAEKAARFLRANVYDGASWTLSRRWTGGAAATPGMAADYALLAQGLLDLYETTFDPGWLDWATELTRTQDRLFRAPGGGLYASADASLPARRPEADDGTEPSASAVAALNWLRLDRLTTQPESYAADARRTLARFAGPMEQSPATMASMLGALDFALAAPRQIVIAGKPGARDTQALLRAARSRFVPGKSVLLVDQGPLKARLLPRLPFLEGAVPLRGKAAAYVCEGRACRAPTTDPGVLVRLLDSSR